MTTTIVTPPLDTPSGWRPVSELTPINTTPILDADYKWVVIGAGFTGLGAARRLGELNPADTILFLDARPVGWGASGRNSGFVIDLPHKFELDNPEEKRLKKIIELNRTAVRELENQINTHNIDCSWSRAGKLQGAVGERGIQMMQKFKSALDLIKEPYDILSPNACLDKTGTEYYSQAVFTSGSALVDPLALTRGLARHLPQNVHLNDQTAVTQMCRQDKGYDLTLQSEGEVGTKTILARNVILAVDPFTPEFGFLKHRILPLSTFASITRPLTASELETFRGTLDWGLTPADPAGTTLRMTQEGRILLRNQYTISPKYLADKHLLADVYTKQREGFEKRYPDLDHVPFETTWGGVCGISRNHSAFFGKLADNVFSASCYNGVGVAKGTISGMLLADYASGHKSQSLQDIKDLSNVPSLIPPEPFRSIGGSVRLKFAEWQSRTEF
ncbi:MAG: FAD-binding oxidoreductase [Sneathiella sp.]|nr:FAD-binding oxidoreductase [Sneathiella sp.]